MPSFDFLDDLTMLSSEFIDRDLDISYWVMHIETPTAPTVCPKCGVVGELQGIGRLEQRIQDTIYLAWPVLLVIRRRRSRCKACGRTSMEPLDWLHEQHQMTRRLVEELISQAGKYPNTDVARRYALDEGTVRNVTGSHYAQKEAAHTPQAPLYLGIDEIRIGGKARGIFTDIGGKLIIDLLPDNLKSTMQIAMQSFTNRERTQVIAIDMARAYANLAAEIFPNAVIVVDKFHVVKMANKGLDTYRRELRAGARKRASERAAAPQGPDKATVDAALDPKEAAKAARKAARAVAQEEADTRLLGNLREERYLLLTRRRDLDPMQLLEIETKWRAAFPDLVWAYDLKEQFYDIYGSVTLERAKTKLYEWRISVPKSLKPSFQPLLTASANWEAEILNYFRFPVTNAYTEAMNRMIREIDRAGRGYKFAGLRQRVLFGQEHRRIPRRTSIRRAKSEQLKGAVAMLMWMRLLMCPTWHTLPLPSQMPTQTGRWTTFEDAESLLSHMASASWLTDDDG